MDIIGAMNKEREYLSFRMKGEEPYHLVDAVKEYEINQTLNFLFIKTVEVDIKEFIYGAKQTWAAVELNLCFAQLSIMKY